MRLCQNGAQCLGAPLFQRQQNSAIHASQRNSNVWVFFFFSFCLNFFPYQNNYYFLFLQVKDFDELFDSEATRHHSKEFVDLIESLEEISILNQQDESRYTDKMNDEIDTLFSKCVWKSKLKLICKMRPAPAVNRTRNKRSIFFFFIFILLSRESGRGAMQVCIKVKDSITIISILLCPKK